MKTKLKLILCVILLIFFSIKVAFAETATTVANTKTAIFAGGCFWCMQSDFDKIPGVIKTEAGYTGGTVKDPTYEQVSDGGTGHYESIEVYYDSSKVTYKQLLNDFWRNVDPTDASGQFCDKGPQYRAVIFYQNSEQQKLADASKQQLLASGKFKQIATEILPASTFYPAEEYHQEYYKKNPTRYKFYRYSCGRDKRLEQVWGDN